jgi:hypothetical protein
LYIAAVQGSALFKAGRGLFAQAQFAQKKPNLHLTYDFGNRLAQKTAARYTYSALQV